MSTSTSDRIYLDYNATAPVLPAARAAMVAALDSAFGNPSSKHWAGRAAHAVIKEARAAIARLAGAEPDHVVFTSGATEAIHQVIRSQPAGRLVCGAVEHPAVFGAAALYGREVTRVAPLRHGPITAAAVLAAVDDGPPPALVCVMAANNETGIVNSVDDLIAPLRERGVPLLVDAVQYAGKLPIRCAPDYLVVAAHKFGGPKGAGALVVHPTAPLAALFDGGGQERGKRSGTEPVPAIAGFGAAAAWTIERLATLTVRYATLRDRLETGLLAALPGSFVVGREAARLPNTSSFVLPPGVESEAVMSHLNRAGVAVSAGSACHSGSVLPSPVLLAAGLTPDETFRALRLSLGHGTTDDEIDRVLDLLPATARQVAR
ncbi:MAG: cysteine desulfurase [Deltaproteobacteria bacterium HGW-Deltaproteobacteria-14]|jgi:cysteine desulfurase|nr:MAG: cysteine desulfurase [Deltaproteobacteria bacterium HGW-Deltaproteobacteria-14]